MAYQTLPHGIIDVAFLFDKYGCITISNDKVIKKKRLTVYCYGTRPIMEKIKKIFNYGNTYKIKSCWMYKIEKPQDVKDFLLKINPYLNRKINEVGYLLNNWVFVPNIDYNADFSIDKFNEIRGRKKITNKLQKEEKNASIETNTT